MPGRHLRARPCSRGSLSQTSIPLMRLSHFGGDRPNTLATSRALHYYTIPFPSCASTFFPSPHPHHLPPSNSTHVLPPSHSSATPPPAPHRSVDSSDAMGLPPQYSVPGPMRPRDASTAASGTPERRSTRPATYSYPSLAYSLPSAYSTSQRHSYPRQSTPSHVPAGNPLLAGKALPATPDEVQAEEAARRYTGPLPPPRPMSSSNLAAQYDAGAGSGSSAVPLHPSIRRSGSANSIRGPSTRRSSRSSRSSGSAASPPSSFRLSQTAERTPAHSAFTEDSGLQAAGGTSGVSAHASNLASISHSRSNVEPPRSPPREHPFVSGRESASSSGSSPEKSERRRRREKEEKDRQRLERRRRRAARAAKSEADARYNDNRPTLSSTINLLLLPFRVVLMPLRVVLGPVLWHLLNALVILLVLAGLGWIAVLYIRHALSGLPEPLSTAVGLPFKLAATPACLLTGIACELSLVGKGWGWRGLGGGKKVDVAREVDVAAVSRGLSKEARHAKDIFESLTVLGDGRMTQGLGHVR